MLLRRGTSWTHKSLVGSLATLACVLHLSSPAHAETASVQRDKAETAAPNMIVPANLALSDNFSRNCASVDFAYLSGIETPAPSSGNGNFETNEPEKLSSLDRARLEQTLGKTNMIRASLATSDPAIRIANAESPAEEIAKLNDPSTPAIGCAPTIIADTSGPIVADDHQILGSLRIAINRTPFDRQWDNVSKAGPPGRAQYWLAHIGLTRDDDLQKKVDVVNRWVNSQITYANDVDLYGLNDYWANARDSLRLGKGDCEDFAILKMGLLAKLGVDRTRMSLIVARDLLRNADHAILFVQLDGGSVILDSATDNLLDGSRSQDYRPIMSFSANGKWLHGYAVADITSREGTGS